MFDKLVHSGMSQDDSAFVELAIEQAQRIKNLTEQAIASGDLTMAALFDENLIQVAGSNPEQYRTGLSDWADTNWRPLFDAIGDIRPEILTSVCTSAKGFLPTHMSKFSVSPTGDFEHDKRYCRNGRVFFEGVDITAKASVQDYMMAVYRHTGTSGASSSSQAVVRNVYVPLYINDRRWGDFEIAYILGN